MGGPSKGASLLSDRTIIITFNYMLNFLRIDLLQLTYTVTKLKREFKPELVVLAL